MRHLFKMPKLFKVTLVVQVPFWVMARNEQAARKEATRILTRGGFPNEVALTVEEHQPDPAEWLSPEPYTGEIEPETDPEDAAA